MYLDLKSFNHRQINVKGISTHIVETGDKNQQTILFLMVTLKIGWLLQML